MKREVVYSETELRAAASEPGGCEICFGGDVHLSEPVKFIGGRWYLLTFGARLTGGGLKFIRCETAKIEGIQFQSIERGDAIELSGCKDAALMNCSFDGQWNGEGADGAVDIVDGCDRVELRDCRFHRWRKTVLIGATPEPRQSNRDSRQFVTMKGCTFSECAERQPKLRWGTAALEDCRWVHPLDYVAQVSCGGVLTIRGSTLILPVRAPFMHVVDCSPESVRGEQTRPGIFKNNGGNRAWWGPVPWIFPGSKGA